MMRRQSGVALLVAALLLILPATLLAQTHGGSEIFIPQVVSGGVASTPAPVIVGGDRVYGLLGTLTEVTDAGHSTLLTTPYGASYGLVGETPDVEEQLVTLARARSVQAVKVWGEVLSIQSGGLPLIVVSGVMATGAAPAVGGASDAVAIVKFNLVNLYAGPGTNLPKVGQVTQNQVCNITGRNPTRTWWQLTCADGTVGWIDARLVTVEGSTVGVPIAEGEAVEPPVTPVAPVPTPLPTPTPTPVAFSAWRAEYFDNTILAGTPLAVDDVGVINFNWGLGSPNAAIPADGFSARFVRQIRVAPGFYRITADADDGVRVWLDDQLIIDEWHGADNRVYSVSRVLTGDHRLRVEYFEASGLASLRFDYESVDQTRRWDAEYYAGVQPSGNTVLRQTEPASQTPLDLNWSYSSPLPGQLGADYWSARWTGVFPFEYGTYVFRVEVDDGVRVFVDGLLLIDQWRDGYKEVSNRFVDIGAGDHTITVEFYERTGLASVKLWWYRETGTVTPR